MSLKYRLNKMSHAQPASHGKGLQAIRDRHTKVMKVEPIMPSVIASGGLGLAPLKPVEAVVEKMKPEPKNTNDPRFVAARGFYNRLSTCVILALLIPRNRASAARFSKLPKSSSDW
jgi:hypothetical protein